jgi:hypothetical protein
MHCLAQIHYNSAYESSTVAVWHGDNPRPWEFALRPEECRTPARCRYIIARAIQYVCAKIEQDKQS